MERIFDKKKVAACIAKSKYHSILDTMDIDFYLINYEKIGRASCRERV